MENNLDNARKNLRIFYLDIQARQLAEWKTLLKPEVYSELEKRVLESNKSEEVAKNYGRIKRGVDIDMILQNEVRPLFKN